MLRVLGDSEDLAGQWGSKTHSVTSNQQEMLLRSLLMMVCTPVSSCPRRARLPCARLARSPLTEEVGVCPYGHCEAVSWLVDAEEEHGHILGGRDAPSAETTGTQVHIALWRGKGVVLGARELLSLEDPAVEDLQECRGTADAGSEAGRGTHTGALLHSLFFLSLKAPTVCTFSHACLFHDSLVIEAPTTMVFW